MSNKRYRGIIHLHSRYSYDSFTSIKSIARFAHNNSHNFIILTDHNRIIGSQKLSEYIKKKSWEIEVPMAAEYKTDLGDVIAVFIKNEIKNMHFPDFVSEVRKQNGLILFPHPFIQHLDHDTIASVSDLIEIFNARNSKKYDDQALNLANNLNKYTYYGSDSHLRKNLGHVIVEFEKKSNLKQSLLESDINALYLKKISNFDILITQLIKGIKYSDLLLIIVQLKKIIFDILKIPQKEIKK